MSGGRPWRRRRDGREDFGIGQFRAGGGRSFQVDTLADEGVGRIVATASIRRAVADQVTLLSVSRDIPTAEGLGAEVPLEDALPGDILQFSWCKFFRREAEGASFVSYYAGDEKSHGEHTAVVFAVERRAPLRAIALEQNINGRLCVTHRVYDFSEMTHGKCVAYRGR